MIFSSALSVLLLCLLIYSLLQKKEFPILGRTLPLICIAGVYVAWFPESTSEAASFVGIGRGVDLMLYVWLLASGMLILGLHLKLVNHDRRLTELARFLAIAGAQSPAPPSDGETRPAAPSS